MNKGFLVMAQNGQTDYVRMASTLAMSLKLSQSEYNNVSIIVNRGQEIKHKEIFDQIISIDNVDSKWKIDNKWQYFDLSPYDETIVLDADMLFFHDISHWWDILSDKEIEFTTHTKNYRGDTTTSDYYRKTFTTNKLPNLHTALFYFKKTKLIEKYFEMVRLIFENWKEFYKRFLKEPPKFLSGDVAYALASKIIFNRKWDSFLTFTHMRSRLQDNDIVSNWNKELPSFFTTYHGRIELKINNFNQMYPFHYIKKDFLSEEVVKLYEEKIYLL
jgi:hypothetical protein